MVAALAAWVGKAPSSPQTVNAVSARLTTRAIQRLNAAVDVDHRSPAAVARGFPHAEVLR